MHVPLNYNELLLPHYSPLLFIYSPTSLFHLFIFLVFGGTLPSKTNPVSSVALMLGENEDLCSLLHPLTKHLHCLWDIVATSAGAWRKIADSVQLADSGNIVIRNSPSEVVGRARVVWRHTAQKSKWLDNWDCLVILLIFFSLIEWLCPYTAKIHLYTNTM